MRTCVFIGLIALAACQPAPQVADLPNPAGPGARFPYLHASGGAVIMSWMEEVRPGFVHIRTATFDGESWTTPESVDSSGSYFVNWADFPSVVGLDGHPLAAHWLQKVDGGTYAYHIRTAFRNADGGWGPAFSPHTDGTPTEHGFVSLMPLSHDRVLAVWLDGRHTGGGGHEGHDTHDGHHGMMTLRSAEITPDGRLLNESEIDGSVCDCCQTGLAPVPGGAVAVYRDRSHDEIRDISLARYENASGTWTPLGPLHDDGWEITGCPVNGPRIESNGDHVVAAWFTMADGMPVVAAKRSTDGGRTFGERIVIDETSNSGRVDVVVDADGTAWISWLGTKDGDPALALRSWSAGGRLGAVFHPVTIDKGRRSGFPRMARLGDTLILAWTDPENGFRVRTVTFRYRTG